MSRRIALALIAVSALALSACSVVSDLTAPDQPAPTYSASGLTLSASDVPTGSGWVEVDTLPPGWFVESTGSPDQTIDPSSCPHERDPLLDADGQEADASGLKGLTSDGTTQVQLAIIKDGRTLDDLRAAREECDEVTVKSSGNTFTQSEDIGDGPDVDGADETLEFSATWRADITGDDTEHTMHLRGLIAEVRGTLVVVLAVPSSSDPVGFDTPEVSDGTAVELEQILTAQVAEIVNAP